LSINVAIPKVEKSPEKGVVTVKGVKINEMSICERASLTRALTQAVLIIYRLQVIALVSLGSVYIGQ
jgi:ABC-type hemin transport system ATPase subunit